MGLGDKMFSGIIWGGIERIAIQAVQFILGIILARLLTPKEYGIIGILIVFIAISKVFIDSGFTKALIQKKGRTQNDISTVFLFNNCISLICYGILWFSAPIIADFYEITLLTILLRVLALSLIVDALFAIPSTLLTIKMDFKTLTKINFISTIISGSFAIYLAYTGWGVWALVWQTLTRSLLTSMLMWYWVRWIPNWVFSVSSFKTMFSFGSKLLASSLLNTTVNNLYSLFIAKFISAKDLGYYTRGSQFSDVVYSTSYIALERVLLPGLATIQDQKNILIEHTRKIIKLTALLIVPIFLLLATLAEPIISVLLTEKWLPAVPIMQIFCVARMITVISGININLLYVIGRTDLALRQQFVKIVIRLLFFVIALKFGIVYIALAELVSTTIHFFINTYYPGKIMNYGAIKQLKDLSLIFGISFLMVLIVRLSMELISNELVILCVIPFLALSLYVGLAYLFKVPEYFILLNKIKSFLNKSN